MSGKISSAPPFSRIDEVSDEADPNTQIALQGFEMGDQGNKN
jgi:hypothetical protein